jgi:hypothetical protein
MLKIAKTPFFSGLILLSLSALTVTGHVQNFVNFAHESNEIFFMCLTFTGAALCLAASFSTRKK